MQELFPFKPETDNVETTPQIYISLLPVQITTVLILKLYTVALGVILNLDIFFVYSVNLLRKSVDFLSIDTLTFGFDTLFTCVVKEH